MTDSKPPEQRNTTRVVIISVVCLVLYLSSGIILLWRLNIYVDPTAIEDSSKEAAAKKDLIQAWGFIMAGVAGAVGIFFTWRAQRLAREAQEQNQRNTQEQLTLSRQSQEQNQQSTQEQLTLSRQSQEENQRNTLEQLKQSRIELDLTRQGQMTERFTQAIEQLGSDKLEIKLGGIYSLERTAQEEKNYHWPVMEVLTSYVRRHAARKPDKELRESAATPEADIQAILDVIGRRSEYHRTDNEVEYGTIELKNTDLQGANLRGAHLYGAHLQGANLEGASLPRANLDRAYLRGADLQRANLEGAVLRDANLEGANLEGASLRGADLQEARELEQDQIRWTIGSNETQLPVDRNRPEWWSKSFEEQVEIVKELIHRG